MLSFDLAPDIQPRIGIEYDLQDPATHSHLPDLGLFSDWVQQSPYLAETLASQLPSPLPQRGPLVFSRRLNHVKHIYKDTSPPSTKTYLFLALGWPAPPA